MVFIHLLTRNYTKKINNFYYRSNANDKSNKVRGIAGNKVPVDDVEEMDEVEAIDEVDMEVVVVEGTVHMGYWGVSLFASTPH